MAKRKKRLEKQVKGLKKQKEKHEDKIKFEKGKLDTTPEYWRKEILGFEEQIAEREELLKRLEKEKKR